MRYEITRKDDPSGRTELRVFDRANKPSWKRLGTGRASIRLDSHRANPFLSIDVEEFADPGFTGKGASSKRTIVSIGAEAMPEVYAWLKSIYEPEAPVTKKAGE